MSVANVGNELPAWLRGSRLKDDTRSDSILGCAGRIMADPEPMGSPNRSANWLTLQFSFPEPGTAVVAATRITEDQDFVLALKAGTRRVGPPLCDGMGGKFGRIIGVAQIDIALVMDDVIAMTARLRPSASPGKSQIDIAPAPDAKCDLGWRSCRSVPCSWYRH